ncbi:MAG: hypothetical protein ACRDT5_24490, partial [Mycobacterium sp.]
HRHRDLPRGPATRRRRHRQLSDRPRSLHDDNRLFGDLLQNPDGHSCAIYPNGGPLGCDTVPSDAPAGANQTVVNPGVVAEYRHSDAPSFARAVDALPKRYRLVNWGASCGIDDQGAVTCKTYGEHGFTISRAYGVLW